MSRVENINSHQQHDFMFHHLPVFMSFFPCLGIFYQASAFFPNDKNFYPFYPAKRFFYFILRCRSAGVPFKKFVASYYIFWRSKLMGGKWASVSSHRSLSDRYVVSSLPGPSAKRWADDCVFFKSHRTIGFHAKWLISNS